jgi:hypothetical protein
MMVMCCNEENCSSHYVSIYVLLNKFKAYGLLVVVKGTPPKHMQIRGGRSIHETSNWMARVVISS